MAAFESPVLKGVTNHNVGLESSVLQGCKTPSACADGSCLLSYSQDEREIHLFPSRTSGGFSGCGFLVCD